MGYSNFLVIYLSKSEKVAKRCSDEIERYGDVNIVRVASDERMEDIDKIDREMTQWRMKLGYQAMADALDKNPAFPRCLRGRRSSSLCDLFQRIPFRQLRLTAEAA